MPWTLHLLDGRKGLLLVATGSPTMAECTQVVKDVVALGESMSGILYAIIDHSSLSEEKWTLSSTDVDMLASYDKRITEWMTDNVIAIVAAESAAFGMGRMWQILVDVRGVKAETRVVKTRREAEEWIRERMREKHGFAPAFR